MDAEIKKIKRKLTPFVIVMLLSAIIVLCTLS